MENVYTRLKGFNTQRQAETSYSYDRNYHEKN